MKNTLTIVSAICILFLASCQPKSVILKNVSDNQKVNVTVTANKASAMEPWKVDIAVKAYDFKEGHLAFEVQNGEISDKTVHFDWKDGRNCIITFDQTDGAPRKFQLIADATQVQIAEVNL